MTIEAQIVAKIDGAFGDAPKPVHFTEYEHCEECAEHDLLLRERDRETLRIEDVGNPCWDPICLSSPEGIAYYLPSLVRLAFVPPIYEFSWYGDQLIFHLGYKGSDNRFLRFCDSRRRRAVSGILEPLKLIGASRTDCTCDLSEFTKAYEFWSQA